MSQYYPAVLMYCDYPIIYKVPHPEPLFGLMLAILSMQCTLKSQNRQCTWYRTSLVPDKPLRHLFFAILRESHMNM